MLLLKVLAATEVEAAAAAEVVVPIEFVYSRLGGSC